MRRATTQHLTAVTLAAFLGGLAQPAYPATSGACHDVPTEFRQHLAADGASDRLDKLRIHIKAAVGASGHSPRAFVTKLLADPLTLVGPEIGQSSLPDATGIELD